MPAFVVPCCFKERVPCSRTLNEDDIETTLCMATCLLLTVRAANFLSLMSRKHAWNRCLMEWKWLHCNHSPRPPNREPGSMRKKEKKRRGHEDDGACLLPPATKIGTAKPVTKTDSFFTKKRGPNQTRRSFRPRGPRFGWEDDASRRLRHIRLAFRYVCREVRAKNARVPIRQRFSGRAKRRHPFAKGDLRFEIP